MTRNTWELKLNSTILTHSKKQVDVYCIDLDSEFVDLNYIVASLIFCHFWRSIWTDNKNKRKAMKNDDLTRGS